MLKHWLVVIMILVLQSMIWAATSPPRDANLDKPVTLAVKGEALSDILPVLEKQTGVRLRVVKAIAEQKATIFVDAKPLREVMLGLAALFSYKWNMKPLKASRVYELWEPEKIRREREDISQALAAAIWKQLDSDLAKKVRFYPKDENEIHEAILDAVQKREQGLHSGDDKQLLASQAVWAKILLGTPPVVRTALMNGASVWYDTDTTESEWRIPADIAHVLASVEGGIVTDGDGNPHFPPEDDTVNLNLGIESRIAAYDGNMFASMHSTFQFVRLPGKVPVAAGGSGSSNTTPVQLQAKDILPPDRLPHKQDDALYAKAFQITSEELAREAGVPGQEAPNQPIMVNRSDILALLHRKLGLQVIADHYSKWFPANADKTLAGCIQSVEASPEAPRAYWGWDGSFIYVRTQNVRKWSGSEIPNSQLRSWRETYSEQGWMNLDQLAQMALLSEDQLHALMTDGRYMGIGNERDLVPFLVRNELCLYAVLSPAQRKEAFKGGTRVAGFTSRQLCALIQCINSNRLRSGAHDRPFSSQVGIWKKGVRLDKPQSLTEDDPVLLVMREGTANPSSNASTSLIVVPQKEGQAMQAPAPGYTMSFRFSDGFTIDRPIPVGPPQRMSGGGGQGFGR